jgi:type III secretory pathway lipoprotein EscJ
VKLIFFVLFAVAWSGCATKIAGHLVDAAGNPVTQEFGKVNITRLDGKIDDSFQETIAVTDDGTFESVTEIPAGQYMVEALVPGYKAESIRLQIKESQQIKLVLIPLPKVQHSTIRTNLDLDVGRGAGSATIDPPSL